MAGFEKAAQLGFTPDAPVPKNNDSVVGAAFRQENLIGSYVSQNWRMGEIEEGFDPYEHIKGTKYEQYHEQFADVFSRKEMEGRMADIDQEERDRQTLAEAGAAGVFWAMAAGTLDPTILLPGALPVTGPLRAVKVGRGLAAADDIVRGMSGPAAKAAAKNMSVRRGAANVAAGAGSGAAVQEAALQDTQSLRSIEETLGGVATATILGGILGSAIHGLTKAQLNAMAKDLYRSTAQPGSFLIDMEKGTEIRNKVGVFFGEDSSVGSKQYTGEGTGRLKDEKFVKATWWGKVSELTYNLLLDSDAIRKASAKISDGGMMKGDSEKFVSDTVGGTVEIGVKIHKRKLYDGITSLDDAFVKYYTNGAMPSGPFAKFRVKAAAEIQRWGGSKSDRMDYQTFRREVGKAMARGDAHEIAEVAEAAKAIREKVIKPMKDELVANKMLPEGLDDNYITRLYNREFISANSGDLHKILVENFKRNQDSLVDEQAKINKRLEGIEAKIKVAVDRRAAIKGAGAAAKKKPLTEQITKLRKEAADVGDYLRNNFMEKEGVEIEDLAWQVIDRIKGNQFRTPGLDIIAEARGPLKARVLRVDDTFSMVVKDPDGTERTIRFEDFLERDVEQIMNFYVRTTSADLELHKAFDGDVSFERLEKEINEEKAQKLARIKQSDLSLAERRKENTRIEQEYTRGWRNLQAFRDRIRGVHALPDNPDSIPNRAAQIALDLNYLRLLGGMTISALPDIARHGIVNGFGNTFKALSLVAKDLNQWKLGAEEVKRWGVALDMAIDSRTRSMADIMDYYQQGSRVGKLGMVGKFTNALSKNFGFVSLMAPWNAFQKQLAGVTTMDVLIRATKAASEGKATKKQIQRLADANIDEAMAKKIWKEMQDGGGKQVHDVWLPNTDTWKDKKTARAFGAAIVREVERIIVTPGMEKPNWMGTPTAKIIGQFKSFGMSSVNQMLIAGLQQRDAQFVSGALSAIVLGMAAAKVKAMVAGRDTDDWTVEKWLAEGIDRSGLLGILSDFNNITEKVTRGHVGLSMFTGEQASRYQSRNLISSLIGPTGGLIQDVGTATGSLFAGDWKQSDTHRIRQTIPYQNVFYLRNLLNAIQRSINESVGVEIREN